MVTKMMPTIIRHPGVVAWFHTNRRGHFCHSTPTINLNLLYCLPPFPIGDHTQLPRKREKGQRTKKRRMVEVRAKRGISLVMIIMVFLLKTISSTAHTAAAAAVYNKSNNNDTACCLIADDLESEFLMDSEVRRMLGAQGSPRPLVKEDPSANCGRGKNYIPCVPGKNGVRRPPDEHCDDPFNTRNRGCRPQP